MFHWSAWVPNTLQSPQMLGLSVRGARISLWYEDSVEHTNDEYEGASSEGKH